MVPAVTIDNTPDFGPSTSAYTPPSSTRTLLLAPASLASSESSLAAIISRHDRSTTDLQMLDRLSAGLVSLPPSTYALVVILAGLDGTLTESGSLLDRVILAKVHDGLIPGGKVASQDGRPTGTEDKEFVLAGLVKSAGGGGGGGGGGGWERPDYGGEEVVPLRLKRKTRAAAKKKEEEKETEKVINGVGFVTLDDLDAEDEDYELIDEDTLLTEEDLKRPLTIRMRPSLPGPLTLTLSTEFSSNTY